MVLVVLILGFLILGMSGLAFADDGISRSLLKTGSALGAILSIVGIAVAGYFAGKDGVPTEHRLRAMHLCRELTHSAEDSAIIHGEGSLSAQRMSVYTLGDWEKYKAAAKRAAKIEDGTVHPIFSKLPDFPVTFD